VTVGAPFDPAHVIGLFGEKITEIGDKDEVEVSLAGRPFRVRRTFLEDVKRQNLENHLKTLQKALLIFHSPIDDTVDIENAYHIFAAANQPKSFISLAGADHLLTEAGDAAYVAHLISTWADHYLDVAVEDKASRLL
jgi:esterase/lipase